MTGMECQGCARKSQLFLCFQCQANLRQMLEGLGVGLPLDNNGRLTEPVLEWLEDARLGRTRLGESARQSTEKNTPLVVRLGPKHDWKDSPHEVLKVFHGTLSTWIRHLTEVRGATFIPLRSVPNHFVGPLLPLWRRLARDYRASSADCAEWLAAHVGAIACDEGAGELFHDVQGMATRIERMVNRAVDPKYCGPCPSLVEDEHGQEQGCATALYAPWDHHTAHYAVVIECWKCHAIHNVDQLVSAALDTVAGLLYTATEVQEVMRQIGQPIPSRTWRHWRAQDRIIVRGWREGEPMYWINDVKDLMAQRPQGMPTGAAAHRAAG